MGLFDSIIRKLAGRMKQAPSLSGIWPMFPQAGQMTIYQSDAVRQAIACIVHEIAKLRPMHVRQNGAECVPVDGSDLQRVLESPNELMTTTEFLEKVAWLLMLNENAFILPTYRRWYDSDGNEQRQRVALWPIMPNTVDFIEDQTGALFVKFTFADGETSTVPYSEVIHIRHNYSVNEYLGGNAFGQPDTEAIAETVELNRELLRGVAKTLRAGYSINGILAYNTIMDQQRMETELRRLEERLENNKCGILPVDLKASYTPLARSLQTVDPNTLKFIDEKILRNFGVPLQILTGDFTRDQYAAFYQKTIEGIAIEMSQAMTKKLFTRNELAHGNRVKLYPKDLVFMTVDQTLQMIKELGNTGAITENEKRSALGLPPLAELEGKRYSSLNYIDANNAGTYQVGAADQGNNNGDGGDGNGI